MNKKHIITFSAALLVAAASVTPVWAATETSTLDTDYEKTIDITAQTTGSDAYSVDVEWGNMEFTYAVGGWDTENHKYATEGSATWQPKQANATADAIAAGENYTLGSGQILVRNHSNQPVTTAYDVTSAKPEGFSNVTVSVSTSGATIEACPVLNSASNANVPYQTAEVTLSGMPTMEKTATVGTLTINIEKTR